VKIHNANSNDANDLLEASSSQKVPVVVSHNGKQRPAISESVHTPSESSDSSSDEDDTVVPGSQSSSRYRDDDDEDYAERSSRVARNQEHVKLEDGMTFFQSTRSVQPHANITISQVPPVPQSTTSAFMERATITEGRLTFMLALPSLRVCQRLVTMPQR
jgi:hypothetical protein